MKMKTIMAVIIAGILLSMSAAASEQPVGSIKTLEGTVRISRQGTEVTVTPGQSIFQHDIIRTEAGSRTGIILLDDTMLSLGPGSTRELKEYLFQPKTAQYSFTYNLDLSLRRALKIEALLVKAGIVPDFLSTDSHGKSNPLVPTLDNVPEPSNRRVEVIIR
jgi:hypothetical protein